MLFIQSNSLSLSLNEGERLRLLDALCARGHAPLMRAASRRRFELLVAGVGDTSEVEAASAELERRCMARLASQSNGAYMPGDLFCARDCVFFITFGALSTEDLSAGIIYNIETTEPLVKLDRFCRDVRESLIKIERSIERSNQATASSNDTVSTDATAPASAHEDASADAGEESYDLPCWKSRAGSSSQGLARFIAIQPTDFAVVARCKGGARGYLRATELMESRQVRLFLRRVQEMRREGYSARRLFAEATQIGGVPLERMIDAGLLEREVRVSCRKSGHALFDLPTPDSLAAITISRAKCSLCAAPVADEVIEETVNPSWLAVALLEDGSWLNNRIYKIVRSLGVPDSEIASGPASAHGESYLAAEVCGHSFLFVTRDGDLTPAFARRISETVAQTEATHLVVIVTGEVEDEGRLRLYEFAWRRARDGQDLDTSLIEGLDGAHAEIERAFERAIHRELARRLFTLDARLGFSASNFVLDWFRLTKSASASHTALVPLFSDLDQRVAS
ncbi:MAG: hypothetical protein QOE33_10 [Acidobacteriota bacterium]|nr:hypothetical protein [Acidobacteriota bacterium]